MRRMLLLLLVAVLVATLAVPVAATNGKSTELPFKATAAGYLLGFGPVIGDRCNDSPEGKVAWAVTSFEGWGNATHMGRTYVYAEHCSYAGPLPDGTFGPDGTYGEGRLTIEAANGDTLLATYTDGVSLSGSPDVGFMDYFTFIDGGTGRFMYASGGGVEIGSVNLGSGFFTVEIEGVVSYSKR